MKLTLIPWLTLLLLPAATLLATDVKSGWAPTAFTIDGDGDEWHDQKFSYFDDDKTAIAVSNDSGAVYLIVISRDEATVRQIERSGIVVWLNADGKKNRDYGFRYRAGRLSKDARKSSDGFMPPEEMMERREKMEEEQARQRKVITVIEKKKPTEISNKGEAGPAAAATFGKEIYAIEFKVPLLSSEATGYGLMCTSGEPIMLGIETGYLTDEEKKARQEQMQPPEGGGMRMGMGGGPGGPSSGGGMMGGEHGPGGPGGDMRGQGKKEFWLKVELAKR